MQTFETTEPIAVTVELGVGDVRIAATDRADTRVDVRPSDPSKRSDVIAAEQTSVEYANGRLLVRAPKGWRQWSPLGPRGGDESIEVEIDVPAGSSLAGQAGVGAIRCTGRIGEMPIPHGRRGHPGRRGRPGRAQDRRRRRHARPDRRHRRGHDGIRRRRDREGRRTADRQERQRRHVDRRGHGRGAGERGQRRDLDRSRTRRGGRQDRQRRRPPGRGRNAAPWSPRAPSAASRSASAIGVAAWLDLDTKFGTVQNGSGCGRPSRTERGRGRGARPARPWATSRVHRSVEPAPGRTAS